MTERFDWPALMAAGIRGLQLRPVEFWALTPAELAFLLGPVDDNRSLGRDGLKSLIDRFPDRKGSLDDR